MGEAVCEQLVYTWHATTLHGSAGHGVVLRSAGWPGKLALPGGQHSEVTAGASSDTTTQVFCVRASGGTLFGARTRLGTDGSGRPGNFLVHALFDPSGSVGFVDALGLDYRTSLAPEVRPDDQWAPATVVLAGRWPRLGMPAHEALADIAPLGLLNSLDLASDTDPIPGLVSALDAAAVRRALGGLQAFVDEARRLGGPDRWSQWWTRRPWTPDEWAAKLRIAVLCLRSPSQLSADELVEVGQRQRTSAPEYARELVGRLASSPVAIEANDTFRDLVVDEALRTGQPAVVVPLVDDEELLRLVTGGALGTPPPAAAVGRLLSGTSLPPAAVLRTLIAHPRFWTLLAQAPTTRRDELAAWLLRRGGVKVPDWYAPVIVRQGTDEYERFFGKMDAGAAYDRLFSLVGDAGAIETMTHSGDLSAWSLALARRGGRRQADLRPVVASFNALAPTSHVISGLHLTTVQHLRRTKLLIVTLLVLLLTVSVVAAWAVWLR